MRLRDILTAGGWDLSDPDQSDAPAVTGAESGGNPTAKNKSPCGTRSDGSPAYAVGLMQVCTIHLDKGGLLEGWSEDDLRNPVANARAAKTIFDAQGWGAWTTHANGAYQRYPNFNPDVQVKATGGGGITDIAKKALGKAWDIIDLDLPDVSGAVSGTANAIADVPGAIGGAVTSLTTPSTWFAIGKVVMGGLLVLVGVGGIVFVVAKNVPAPTPLSAVGRNIGKTMNPKF